MFSFSRERGFTPTPYTLHPIPYQGGQAMMITVVFFLFISLAVMFGMVNPTLTETKLARSLAYSSQSYFLSEGGVEDVLYRLKNNLTVDTTETLSLGGAIATTTITDTGSNEKDVTASSNNSGNVRKSKVHVTITTGVSFSFGVQAGPGGFNIQNNASINGNAYSAGPIVGSNSNSIRGDVISSGPSGSITGIRATSSAYAHTISNSVIDKNAYYQTISGSTVGGTSYPGSADQPIADLPIADTLIDQWETDAAAGGTIASPCPYKITSNITIGPKKIACDIEISGSPTVTLTGPLWVTGNIDIKNSPTLRVSSSLPGKSIVIVADNPANRTTSSKIELENSTVVAGSGAGSYVLMVSRNTSAESGGSEEAIEVQNSAQGALLVYANHGEIHLQNSASLKEVTGWKIKISNNAAVTYETGLASLLFTSGPGGSWAVNSWKEIQ